MTNRFLKLNEAMQALGVRNWSLNFPTLAKVLPILFLGVVLFEIFAGSMAWIQFTTPDMPGNDGFYHIKMAYLMRTEGLRPDFPWLPQTILNAREYSNHHFLFHVALIPFTFSDLIVGAKWAAVLFASLAFLSIWWFLRGQGTPHAALWALGLLVVSEAFLYRMSIPRAQSLSLVVLVIGLHLLLTKKYKRLLPLAFLYVWLYDAFPLLILLSVVYILAEWITARRLDLRPLLFVGLGSLLGLLIHPYFPNNLVFLIRHILPKLSGTTAISVGSEWYPYDTAQLIENSPLALVAFLSGVIALGLRSRRMNTQIATSLFASLLFGAMLFQSRRFIEYFPAFVLIFAAFAWAPLIEKEGGRTVTETNEFKKFWRERNWIAPAVMLVMLVIGYWQTLPAAAESVSGSKPYQRYAGAAGWLKENTPPSTRIFQTDWDDFPRLFYYNTHNIYLVGLDPTFMRLYNAELYDRWVEITRGEVDNPAEAIYAEFGSAYVLTDLHHEAFIQTAAEDPGLEEAYRDEDAMVYRVLEQVCCQ